VPNIKSAKKRMRQAATRRESNRAQRAAVRTAMKRVRLAGTADEAQAAYRQAERLLDRAARKGLLQKNAAARHKSRLHKAVQQKAT
jgi:small subunit ribosomal protein S20